MRQALSLALCVLLAVPGCALQSASTAPRFSVPVRRPAARVQEVPASYVSQLPVGRRVEVVLKNGSRFQATFMGLEGDQVRLQKRTRIPESPLLIPLGQITSLSLHEGSGGVAKAILIGAAVGAAAFFGLFLIAVANSD